MKISNYRHINKGSIVGSFNIVISKWGDFEIRNLMLFQKDGRQWITFPQKEYEKDGKTCYFPLFSFKDPKNNEIFQSKVKKLLNEYLKNNKPQVQDNVERIIEKAKELDGLPF